RSVTQACAVSAIMGILRVASLVLRRRVTSQPPITGRLMSIKIRSGISEHASECPCWPSWAVTTEYPLRCKRLESMSRFISLSSTNRIFGMIDLSRGSQFWFPLRFSQRIRSEEHTSELQSRFDLVCRLLLEKKKL